MPTGAVYQPTTVTYEQQPTDQRWNCPFSYFSRRLRNSLNQTLWVRLGLVVLGTGLTIVGCALLIAGAVQHSESASLPPDSLPINDGKDMLIAGGVVLFFGLTFAGIGGLIWLERYRAVKESSSGGVAALGVLNPSTDPLVAAQYAPVRDAPPAPDDEMRNLMDNKDVSSADENDKMLEVRPSIA